MPLISSDLFPGLRMWKTQPKFQVPVAYPAHLLKTKLNRMHMCNLYDTFQESYVPFDVEMTRFSRLVLLCDFSLHIPRFWVFDSCRTVGVCSG